MKNLKALGLALVAVFAMSAVAATAAQANEFTSSEVPVELTGGEATPHLFATNTGAFECETASFTGTLSTSPSATVEVEPTYGGCNLPGLFTLEVKPNGCHYRFSALTHTTGDISIVDCGTNKFIQMGSLIWCRLRFPEQADVPGITYHEVGNNLLIAFDVTTLKYEEEGIACHESGTTHTNGIYTGSTEEEGNHGSANLSVS